MKANGQTRENAMPEIQVTICNQLGLHARAASRLVQEASRFESQVFLERDGREVNAKSIMGVMMLAASKGTEVTVRANGPDADEVLEAIRILVENRFGEEQ